MSIRSEYIRRPLRTSQFSYNTGDRLDWLGRMGEEDYKEKRVTNSKLLGRGKRERPKLRGNDGVRTLEKIYGG